MKAILLRTPRTATGSLKVLISAAAAELASIQVADLGVILSTAILEYFRGIIKMPKRLRAHHAGTCQDDTNS